MLPRLRFSTLPVAWGCVREAIVFRSSRVCVDTVAPSSSCLGMHTSARVCVVRPYDPSSEEPSRESPRRRLLESLRIRREEARARAAAAAAASASDGAQRDDSVQASSMRAQLLH